MKYCIVIYALMGFFWLSYYSMHQPVHHYYANLNQRQAAALQDLYNITDDEIAKPVVLFGE